MDTDNLYLASVDRNSRQRMRSHRNNALEEGKVGILQGNLNSDNKRD